MQRAEAGVRKVPECLQTLKEGDLKGLERQVVETIFAVGCGWMEGGVKFNGMLVGGQGLLVALETMERVALPGIGVGGGVFSLTRNVANSYSEI